MLKIIVVDDSLIMRKNITKMITEMGFKVVGEAKDGLEAISCFRKFDPDLVTMDITMPDMNGIEAVREIRKLNKNAKIVMATSHGQEEMVLSAIKAGASGYVLKPIKSENLFAAIKKIFPGVTNSAEPKSGLNDDDEFNIKIDD